MIEQIEEDIFIGEVVERRMGLEILVVDFWCDNRYFSQGRHRVAVEIFNLKDDISAVERGNNTLITERRMRYQCSQCEKEDMFWDSNRKEYYCPVCE